MAQDSAILLLYEVGLMTVVSSIASELFKRMKLPSLIGAIIVGIFLGGPGGLGLVTDLTVINILAVLGSVLILFMTGLEFEASAFWKAGRKAFLLTTIGVTASFLTGYLIGLSLGWSDQAAFFLGTVIAPSGTSVIAALLSFEGKVETKDGSTLLTACIIDDVEGVLLLAVALSAVAASGFSIDHIFKVSLVSTLFVLGSIYVGSRLFPTLIYRFEKTFSDEALFAVLLGLGLILSFAATHVGLAAITGAFIMGATIPYKKVGEKLANRLVMMKEIFAAVFFTSIGLSINPFDIPNILPIVMLVLSLAIAARMVGGIVSGVLGKLRGRALLAAAIGSMIITLPLFSKLLKSID